MAPRRISGLLCSRTGCQSLGTSQPDPSTKQMQMREPNTQSSAAHALCLLQSWKRLGPGPAALYGQVLGTVWDVGQARDHLQQRFPRACPVWKAESLALSGCPCLSGCSTYTSSADLLMLLQEGENETAVGSLRPDSRFKPCRFSPFVLCCVPRARLADLKQPGVFKS